LSPFLGGGLLAIVVIHLHDSLIARWLTARYQHGSVVLMEDTAMDALAAAIFTAAIALVGKVCF